MVLSAGSFKSLFWGTRFLNVKRQDPIEVAEDKS